MKDDDLFGEPNGVSKRIERLGIAKSTDAERERDAEIKRLLEKGMRITRELDPIVRETCRDNKEALAEWDEIMHMCDDLEEEEIDISGF